MKTVGEANAASYDRFVVYWKEPTRHGTERTHLTGVSIETELSAMAAFFAKDADFADDEPPAGNA